MISGTSTARSLGFFRLHYTPSTHQTNTPIYAGWSIADTGKYYYGDSWNDYSTVVKQFELAASPNPNLAASGVTATTATLTLSNHDGEWWYKGNQSGATCTAVAAGTASASLASLTAGTSYTYNAYGKANCGQRGRVGRGDVQHAGGVQRQPRGGHHGHAEPHRAHRKLVREGGPPRLPTQAARPPSPARPTT